MKWFPVIWSDRDWDEYFILKILQFKLKSMEKSFRKYDNTLGSEKRADEMKRCSYILKRLLDDEYEEQELKPIDDKWGELKITTEPCEDRKGMSKVFINRDGVKTKEDEEQERKEFNRAMKQARVRKTYDIEYMFSYMNKKIQGWWD